MNFGTTYKGFISLSVTLPQTAGKPASSLGFSSSFPVYLHNFNVIFRTETYWSGREIYIPFYYAFFHADKGTV